MRKPPQAPRMRWKIEAKESSNIDDGIYGCQTTDSSWRPESAFRKKYPDLRIAAVTADIDGASSFDMSIFDAVLTKPVTLEKIGLILSTRDWTKFKSAR